MKYKEWGFRFNKVEFVKVS